LLRTKLIFLFGNFGLHGIEGT